MIYGLVASFKAEKRRVNVGDAWFRLLPLSLSLSLSERESWSSSLQGRLPSFDLAPLSRNLSFIAFFSSDRISWVFFVFYCENK